MTDLERILEKAEERQGLSRDEIASLLTAEDKELEPIFRVARSLRHRYFRNKIFLYGFIYFSTWCRNDCAFCFYRRSNPKPPRYRKTPQEVLEAAGSLAESGVHLIDLTSGEEGDCFTREGGYERLAGLVKEIKSRFRLPVMLSPGVVPAGALRLFAAAGADWYACYQETHNRALFRRLRGNQSFDGRLRAKRLAREYGMLVEEGILKGVGETVSDIIDSLTYMEKIGARQIRVMSFVPQPGTPMDGLATPDRSGEMKAIAVMRLLFPDRLIPASLDVDGVSGLQARLNAGANVVTSLIPPHLGLAGVARSSEDIDEGYRTVQGIRPLLERLDLVPATVDDYRSWIEMEKGKADDGGYRKAVKIS